MNHDLLMKRCIDLGKKALGKTYPNPNVGALLFYDGKIISEGFTQEHGKNHAEINAIKKVNDRDILKKSTLYIGVDSCMLHLANYLGVKSLGLFGPTCAVYNSFHLFKKFNYLQAKTKFIRHKNLKDFDCMNQIKVNDVYSKVMDLC